MPKTPKKAADKAPAETSSDPFESPAEETKSPKKAAASTRKPVKKAAEPKKAERVVKARTNVSEDPDSAFLAKADAPAADAPAKTKRVRKDAKTAAPAKTVERSKAPKTAAKRVKTAPKKAAEPSIETPSFTEVTASAPPLQPVKEEPKRSRAFEILADVELPKKPRANRARLLMQSPTRLYFYWSLREDPWLQLQKAFGTAGAASYMLVAKLKDHSRNLEEMHRVEREGEWWFEIEPDSVYSAEIGFYSPSRPYFRIIYTNRVHTPRRGPSPLPATDADWRISANKFAQVLDVSGFQRDAFDVAMIGDDYFGALDRSERALARLIGRPDIAFKDIPGEDIRYALLSLASGTEIEQLRPRIGRRLFSLLENSAPKIAPDSARDALNENFQIDDSEWSDDEPGSYSIGGSIVNFPKRLRARKLPAYSPRYNPVSSFALR